MKEHKINFILIQIDEAHSSAWPTGLKNTPSPQKSIDDRINRAIEFIKENEPPFEILIDTWENSFANKYKTWPDKYYCIDKNLKIIAKAEYGNRGSALIDKDCCDLIEELIADELERK
jgi:hypothetical protein